MRKLLVLGLLFLTACGVESLCFNETPKVIMRDNGSETIYEARGNLILTSCSPEIVDESELDAKGNRKCIADGRVVGYCSRTSKCQIQYEAGEPIAFCVQR